VNSGEPVHLIDMHATLTAADRTDGIHPAAGGDLVCGDLVCGVALDERHLCSAVDLHHSRTSTMVPELTGAPRQGRTMP